MFTIVFLLIGPHRLLPCSAVRYNHVCRHSFITL